MKKVKILMIICVKIWMSLNENSRFWQTISASSLNERVSGGASRGIDRISSKAINRMPYFLKANVKPFGLQLRKQKLFFCRISY